MFLVLAFAIQIFSLHHAANLDITQKMPVVAAKYVLRSVYFCSQFYIRCSLLSKGRERSVWRAMGYIRKLFTWNKMSKIMR